jgi:hypothetical protein
MVQAHQDRHDKTYSPSVDWKDLAWVLRSWKVLTAAPSRASWLVASLPYRSASDRKALQRVVRKLPQSCISPSFPPVFNEICLFNRLTGGSIWSTFLFFLIEPSRRTNLKASSPETNQTDRIVPCRRGRLRFPG